MGVVTRYQPESVLGSQAFQTSNWFDGLFGSDADKRPDSPFVVDILGQVGSVEREDEPAAADCPRTPKYVAPSTSERVGPPNCRLVVLVTSFRADVVLQAVTRTIDRDDLAVMQ